MSAGPAAQGRQGAYGLAAALCLLRPQSLRLKFRWARGPAGTGDPLFVSAHRLSSLLLSPPLLSLPLLYSPSGGAGRKRRQSHIFVLSGWPLQGLIVAILAQGTHGAVRFCKPFSSWARIPRGAPAKAPTQPQTRGPQEPPWLRVGPRRAREVERHDASSARGLGGSRHHVPWEYLRVLSAFCPQPTAAATSGEPRPNASRAPASHCAAHSPDQDEASSVECGFSSEIIR